MTRMEELLRETLAERALDIPAGSAPPVSTIDGTLSTHHTRTVLVSIAAAVLLVGGFATVRAGLDQGGDGVVSPASDSVETDPTPLERVEGLTGEAVGEVLGLEPITDNVVIGCNRFVQFQESAGFCLEGVTDDPLEEDLLALQIQGYERTEAAKAYARARLAYENVTDISSVEAIRLNELAQQAFAELRSEQPNATSGD